MHKKVLIATGGTGGHLFPAQAFARKLGEKATVLFTGANLATSRCFHRDLFAFKEISSAAFLTKNPIKAIKGLNKMRRGVKEAIALLNEFKPDVVVGFGSFHAAPLLFAALMKKVPIILFEADSKPGKVNRLFSRFALLTAIQFPSAKERLFSETILVRPPLWIEREAISAREARLHYDLDPQLTTLLIFGGSQGAKRINTLAAEASLLAPSLQVIHFTGSEEESARLRTFYDKAAIRAAVKPFEQAMHYAWSAASLVICRSGAASIAEQIAFEVPALLIPYPAAAGDHQTKNAEWMQNDVKGAFLLPEHLLTKESLAKKIEEALAQLPDMKAAIKIHKEKETRTCLAELVMEKIITLSELAELG